MDPEFASSAQSSRSSSPQRGTGAQHTLMSVRSDTNLARQGMKKGVKGSPPASARLLSHPSLERSDTTTTAGSEEKRHISFNSRVDQCIAVDYPEEEDEDDDDDDDEYGYSDGDFVDGDEDEAAGRSHFEDGASSPGSGDDEGDVLTMKSSPRSVSGSSRQSSFSSSNDHHHIIAKLAPTRLKTSDAYPAPSPAVVDPTGFTSMHGQGQHNGSASSASGSIIAGGSSDPKVSSQPHAAEERSAWDDDGVPGVDYFNAPYLADRGSSSKGTGGAHTGSVVTAQPTLVSGASGSDAGSSSDAASSSSSTAASSAGAAPQPRSILKRRNSGQDAAAAAATVPKDEVAAAAAQVATAAKTPGSGSPFLAQNVSPNSEVDNKANAEAKSAASGAAATGSSSTSAVTSTYDNDTSDDDDAAPEEEEPGRGRPSQRLGSSASYERIQEAARKSSTSTSASGSSSRASSAASSSMSPSGSQQRGASATATIATDGGSYAARRASFSDDDGSSSVASYTSATGSASGPSGGKSSGRKGSSSSLRGSSSHQQQHAGPSSSSSSSGKGLPPANSQRLSVDLDNLPSNDPAVQSRLQSKQQGGTAGPTPGVGGPTPLNTPTLALAKRRRAGSSSVDDDENDDENDTGDEESLYYTSGRGSSSASAPLSPVIPRRTTATGALVAPSGADRQAGVRVPLADDFVEEDEGGIVGRAVEIVNTARDLIAAVWPTRGR